MEYLRKDCGDALILATITDARLATSFFAELAGTGNGSAQAQTPKLIRGEEPQLKQPHFIHTAGRRIAGRIFYQRPQKGWAHKDKLPALNR